MSKQNPINVAASVRQRLLNLAHERKEEFQFLLVRFAAERLLFRLSRSRHGKRFVLKGAMLFQLWTSHAHRSTLDLDLLSVGGDAAVEEFVAIFKEVCGISVENDGLTFDVDNIHGEEIREDQRYHGTRIHTEARLGTARFPLQIDIGFGDAVTPQAAQVRYPTLLQHPAPIIRAYPKETVVAEKWEAMTTRGIANSRMKDFYDVWILSNQFEFSGEILARAIGATFKRRGTPMPTSTPLALTHAFATDSSKKAQWLAFIKRSAPRTALLPFEQIIADVAAFLWPVTQAISSDRRFPLRWPQGGPWKSSDSS